MKILLINPPFTAYGGMRGHGGKAPPINLAYIASYLLSRRKDDQVKILDAEALGLTFEDIGDYIRKNPPDVLGVTASTPAYTSALNVAASAKAIDKNIKVVMGGIHISAFPDEACAENNVDAAVIGEGELTFTELIGAYDGGSGIGAVKGVCFKKDGQVIRTAPRPLVENLDELPFPQRSLIPNELYKLAPTKRVSLYRSTILTSARGCPFNCSFCSAKVVWHRRYRARSFQNVIAEIEQCITDFGIREFSMTDEFFTVDKKRAFEFCDEVARRKLKIAWVCMSRAGGVTGELLKAMKRAGCREISFGLESGDARMLKLMHKEADLDAARESIRLTKKAGIKTHASYLIGHIGETDESIRKTINFAKELNTDIAAFFVASPLPGTELYAQALRLGYIRKDAAWKDFSPLSKTGPVMNLPGLSSEKLMRWHRHALEEYYLRPRYILRRLADLGKPVEIINLINGILLFLRIKCS